MTEKGFLLLMYLFILIGLICTFGIKIIFCLLTMGTIIFIYHCLTRIKED